MLTKNSKKPDSCSKLFATLNFLHIAEIQNDFLAIDADETLTTKIT